MVDKLTDKILKGRRISFREAKEIYLDKKIPLFDFLFSANKIREAFKKNKVELCSIVNAKSGNCSQDCRFCAQSGWHKTDIKKYPLLDGFKILKAARDAERNKATCFGIVTSGRGVKNEREMAVICRAVKAIKREIPSLKCSASVGIIGREFLAELKKAGIDRFHHNLETSERYFSKICTTHTYSERLETITSAKALGIRLCSGALFGMGETKIDRLKLAFTLRELEVDSIPLNFLHPVRGTALQDLAPMPPQEILKTIAVFRMVLPGADIKVCGGRVVNLRGLQSLIFFAGASGMMIGNYLTQPGQEPAADLEMIRDLGLELC